MGKALDFLIIKFINLEKNRKLFVSDDGTKSLDPASFVMIKESSKQMPNNTQTDSIITTA